MLLTKYLFKWTGIQKVALPATGPVALCPDDCCGGRRTWSGGRGGSPVDMSVLCSPQSGQADALQKEELQAAVDAANSAAQQYQRSKPPPAGLPGSRGGEGSGFMSLCHPSLRAVIHHQAPLTMGFLPSRWLPSASKHHGWSGTRLQQARVGD